MRVAALEFSYLDFTRCTDIPGLFLPVKLGCFAQMISRHFVFADGEVVAAHREPGNHPLGVEIDQFVGQQKQIWKQGKRISFNAQKRTFETRRKSQSFHLPIRFQNHDFDKLTI
jgi:hypothetical protein